MVKVREDMTGWNMWEHGVPDSRLTVIERAEDHVSPNGTRHAQWLCRCNCGNDEYIIAMSHNIKNGNTKSCGCIHKKKLNQVNESNKIKKKKLYRHKRLYKIWADMKARCNNPNHKRYYSYGGRGIHVCKQWNDSFDEFYKWAISSGYNDSLTIDRMDNDKGYYPENCKWSTYKEQENNRRSCHYITYNGETHTISEWGEINNINPTTIRTRIHAGWDEIKAITIQN